jgi:DNA-binding transcriptional ArsR family regulator
MKAEGYFAVIPEWLIDSTDVADPAFRVYAALRRYADDQGEAWPSIGTIAERLNRSERSVSRAIAELEKAGAITVERRFNQSSLYTILHTPPLQMVTELAGGTVKVDRSGPDKSGDLIRAREPEPSSSSPDNGDRRMLFESLYEAWTGNPWTDGVQLTKPERAKINAAARELAKVGATPEQVRERAATYRRKWDTIDLTPQGLVNNWTTLEGRTQAHEHSWELAYDDETDTGTYTCRTNGCEATKEVHT